MNIKKFNDWYLIKEEKMETETIIVKVRKGSANNLVDLLEYIKSNGNVGHSFEIIVDPDLKEKKKVFGWDGDGQDYIESIKIKNDDNE